MNFFFEVVFLLMKAYYVLHGVGSDTWHLPSQQQEINNYYNISRVTVLVLLFNY